MIRDGRSVPTGGTLETEVRIAGAGANGITLAREFDAAPFDGPEFACKILRANSYRFGAVYGEATYSAGNVSDRFAPAA